LLRSGVRAAGAGKGQAKLVEEPQRQQRLDEEASSKRVDAKERCQL
jgi:hypothetical protein